MKIVLNGCYGGFGLSYEAMVLYWHARGKDLYFYRNISTYDGRYKIHKHRYERISLADIQQSRNTWTGYIYCTTEDQGALLDHFPEYIVSDLDINRTDPILISVVETMGSEAASDRLAKLYIEEIPDGTLYKIDYYDGMESIITQTDDDWILAQKNKCSPDITAQIQNLWTAIKPIPGSDLKFKYNK